MSLFKNTASQKVRVFAFDATTGLPKTGDAANITASISKDFGAFADLTDASATEEDSTRAKGYYLFDVSQTETNADDIAVTGRSSTSNIVVVGAPARIATRPPNAGALSIDSSGRVDVIKVNGTSQTARDLGGALPAAAPGASGGLLIAGSNAAATIAGLTLAGAAASGGTPATSGLVVTGGAASTTSGGTAAVAASFTGGAGAASTNGAAGGVTMSGGGTNTVASAAHGLSVTGTSNGTGLTATAGSGSGNPAGVQITGSPAGSGLVAAGGASGGHGISATAAGAAGHGINAASTLGSGLSVTATGAANSNPALAVSSSGHGPGISATGGPGGSGVAAGPGIKATGGAAATNAGSTAAPGIQVTGGAGAASTNGAAAGATLTAGGTTTVGGNDGLTATGTGNGNGATLAAAGTGKDLNATSTPLTLAKTTNLTGLNDIAAADVWAVGTRTLTSSLDPDAAAVAAAVWDLATSGHTTSGTFGAAMAAAGAAGDPWSTTLPAAYGAGTAGYLVGTYLDAAVSSRSTYDGSDTGGTTTLLARLTSTRAGYLDNLSGGAVALASGVNVTRWAGADTAATSPGLGGMGPMPLVATQAFVTPEGNALAPITVTNSTAVDLTSLVYLDTFGSMIRDDSGWQFTAHALDLAPSNPISYPLLTAAVWSADTRTLTGDVTLAASQPNYAPAVAGDAMTLTSAYDAAKTAAQAGDAMTLTVGERDAAADALLARNVAGGSSTGRTVAQALYALRNKVAVSGGTLTVYSTDDATPAWTAAVTSDAAAEPITAVDPG